MKKLVYFLLLLMISCHSAKTELPKENKPEIVLTSEMTCPYCGHKETETMPTDFCLIKYTCKNCKAELFPKEEDCCVFCSYGSHKCPSKQKDGFNFTPRSS